MNLEEKERRAGGCEWILWLEEEDLALLAAVAAALEEERNLACEDDFVWLLRPLSLCFS